MLDICRGLQCLGLFSDLHPTPAAERVSEGNVWTQLMAWSWYAGHVPSCEPRCGGAVVSGCRCIAVKIRVKLFSHYRSSDTIALRASHHKRPIIEIITASHLWRDWMPTAFLFKVTLVNLVAEVKQFPLFSPGLSRLILWKDCWHSADKLAQTCVQQTHTCQALRTCALCYRVVELHFSRTSGCRLNLLQDRPVRVLQYTCKTQRSQLKPLIWMLRGWGCPRLLQRWLNWWPVTVLLSLVCSFLPDSHVYLWSNWLCQQKTAQRLQTCSCSLKKSSVCT